MRVRVKLLDKCRAAVRVTRLGQSVETRRKAVKVRGLRLRLKV